jgi:hypothetical protein
MGMDALGQHDRCRSVPLTVELQAWQSVFFAAYWNRSTNIDSFKTPHTLDRRQRHYSNTVGLLEGAIIIGGDETVFSVDAGRTNREVVRFIRGNVRQWYDPYVYFEVDDRADNEGKGCHRRTPGIAGIGSLNPLSVVPNKPEIPLLRPRPALYRLHQPLQGLRALRALRAFRPRRRGRRNGGGRGRLRGDANMGNRFLPGCISRRWHRRGLGDCLRRNRHSGSWCCSRFLCSRLCSI